MHQFIWLLSVVVGDFGHHTCISKVSLPTASQPQSIHPLLTPTHITSSINCSDGKLKVKPPLTDHKEFSANNDSRYEYVKSFERDDILLPNTWIVIRIDGRGFHKSVSLSTLSLFLLLYFAAYAFDILWRTNVSLDASRAGMTMRGMMEECPPK